MKDSILLELSNKWERNARPPEVDEDFDEDGHSSYRKGHKEGLRNAYIICAKDLRNLVNILGEDDGDQ